MTSEHPNEDAPAVRAAMASRLAFGLLLLALYWLYGFRPFLVHAELVVDDFLYVRQAHGFLDWLQGRSPLWLGQFDCFLLAKAPLYGLWLALLAVIGLPLRVGDFLLLLAGPYLLRRAVRPVTRLGGWPFAVVVVLLVANPMLPGDCRPRREELHVALANLCLVATVGMVLRAGRPRGERARWAALAGFFLGLCYLNREESIWLLAAVAAAAFLLALQALADWRQGWRHVLAAQGRQGLLLLVGLAGFLPPVLGVCTLNYRHYGVFMTALRRSTALTEMIQRLTSLEPGNHAQYVPIARATRLRAYALSPTLARLRPFLEEEGGFWAAGNPAHSRSSGHAPEEREIFDSYVEFCFPHAAERAGVTTAPGMEAMFRAIDRELGDAVRAGQISAGAHGPAILPAPRPGDGGRILAEWWRSLSSLLRVNHFPLYWPDNAVASQAQLDDLARLTSSAVGVYPKPNWHLATRASAFETMKSLERVVCPLFLAAWLGLLVGRRRQVLTLSPTPPGLLLSAVAIPLAGLFAFCLGMAVLEVMSFRFLFAGSYNQLGFSPLSVACALAFVALHGTVAWAEVPQRALPWLQRLRRRLQSSR